MLENYHTRIYVVLVGFELFHYLLILFLRSATAIVGYEIMVKK